MKKDEKITFNSREDLDNFIGFCTKLDKICDEIFDMIHDEDISRAITGGLLQKYWCKLIGSTDTKGYFNFHNVIDKNLADVDSIELNQHFLKCKKLNLIKYKQKKDGTYWGKIEEKNLISKLFLDEDKFNNCVKLIKEVVQNLYTQNIS